VREGNFHEYALLRQAEAPRVDVHLVPATDEPRGAGEPPYPSVAPAIANAIFAASGRRVRRLPIAHG
jgi:isoquinoline 1-oxidoreductase beta subunit